MRDYFAIAHQHLNGYEFKNEFHATCPFCGKEPKARQTHFSYRKTWDTNGIYKCHVCGEGGVLSKLAQAQGWLDSTAPPPKPVKRIPVAQKTSEPTTFPDWMRHGTPQGADRFSDEAALDLWQLYKPIAMDTLKLWNLTIGYPPYTLKGAKDTAKIHLIHPVRRGGKLVMVRHRPYPFKGVDDEGRKIGWKTQGRPKRLTGTEYLIEGVPLLINENFIDGRLMQQEILELNAVASTAGAMGFDAGWVRPLMQTAKPSHVILGFDNDDAGSRATEKIAKLFYDLAKVRCFKLNWASDAPAKADIGDIMTGAVAI